MPHSPLHTDGILAQGDHGGDVQHIARLLGVDPLEVLDFSSNSLVQAHDLTQDIVRSAAPDFDRYPDSESIALRAALAEHESCPMDEILAGNGSAELIWLALAALRPRRAALIGPAFSEYRRACEGLGIQYTIIPPPNELVQWWPQAGDMPPDADLAILCSPNNPGGHTCADLVTCINKLGCPSVFLDLAYRDFLGPGSQRDSHTWKNLKRATASTRLICLHSMTKFFSCTGIRLGYLCADSVFLRSLAAIRASWMVSGFAENIGIALIRRFGEYCARLPLLLNDKSVLASALSGCGAFSEILDGPCFLLGRIERQRFSSVGEMRTRLIQRRILVRDCDAIPGMPPGYARIQVRNTDDTARLSAALEEISKP